jgi:hypothetical protein
MAAQQSRKTTLSIGLGNFAPGGPGGTQNITGVLEEQVAEAKKHGIENTTLFIDPKDGAALEKLKTAIRERGENWDGIIVGGGLRLIPEFNVFFEDVVQTVVKETNGKPKLIFPKRVDNVLESLKRNFPEQFTSDEVVK